MATYEHLISLLYDQGFDYVEEIRKPFTATCRVLKMKIESYVELWFCNLNSDVQCARCLKDVVGLIYLQRGPVHYGCLLKMNCYKEHPYNHVRALRGKFLEPLTKLWPALRKKGERKRKREEEEKG